MFAGRAAESRRVVEPICLANGLLRGNRELLGRTLLLERAAESKQALIANEFDVPYVALCGRRGGSALATAAVNALTLREEAA